MRTLARPGAGEAAVTRRELLTRVVQGIGLVFAGAVTIPPLILALDPALRRRRPAWQPVGPLAEFPLDEVRAAFVPVPQEFPSLVLAEKRVYVWRAAPDEVVVYSWNCTDLSCPLVWEAGSQRFFCPCHGGMFDKQGEPVAGPPREPLWRYRTRLRDGVIEIDLASVPPVA